MPAAAARTNNRERLNPTAYVAVLRLRNLRPGQTISASTESTATRKSLTVSIWISLFLIGGLFSILRSGRLFTPEPVCRYVLVPARQA